MFNVQAALAQRLTMTNILALDQSSKVTGYAIFKDNKLLKSGTISIYGALSVRLIKIREFIINLIKEYNINYLVFEDIQLQQKKNSQHLEGNIVTYKTLAQVLGVITETAQEMEIPFQIIPSVVWKSGLGIKGINSDIQKANAQKYVKDTYNIEVTTDESDAICIGAYFINFEKSAF